MAAKQTRWVDEIYGVLQKLEESKIRTVATGSSDFTRLELHRRTPRRVSNSSEHPRRRQETNVSSITSGETRQSSIFDSVETSSSISSSALPGERLPCEFNWYGNCEESFDLRDIEGWVHHVETQHLRMMLPAECRCWFCDEIVFRAHPDDQQQRRFCYTDRMHHIAGHYRRGATINDIRPDFDFLHHLWINALITESSFQRARNFHEAPQPKHGINSVPPKPSRSRGMVMEVTSRPRRRSSRRAESHSNYRA
ncbi:hypothetical protein V8C35DRAFT_314023 [Trichoderma chlorosporum]